MGCPFLKSDVGFDLQVRSGPSQIFQLFRRSQLAASCGLVCFWLVPDVIAAIS